jgi:hypothetical protein
MDLNYYKCIKSVHATPMTRGVYNAYRGWAMPIGEIAEEPGYLVVYNIDTPDQYESWSPKRIFDAGYIELPGRGLPEYQRRVMLEYNELREKLDKLNQFIDGAVFAALPDDERYELAAQRDAMGEYAKHLHSRIAKFVA